MNKIFMLVAAFAVVMAVFGSMSRFTLGDGLNTVLADKHGGDCCDAPPADDGPHDEPPPDDSHDLDGGGDPNNFDPGQTPDGGSKDGFDQGQSPDGLLPDTTTFPVQFHEGGDFSKDVGDFFQQWPGGEVHFDPNQAPPEGGFDPSAFS